MMIKLVVCTMTLAVVSSAVAGSAMTELTADQLRTDFIGKTFKLVWTDGKQKQTGSQILAADGSESLTMDSGYKDEGTWTMKGNLICSKWNRMKKQSPCAPIYSIGDGKLFWKDKNQSTTFSQ